MNIQRAPRLLAVLLVLLLAPPAAAQTRNTDANGRLPRSTPEAQGVSSTGILAFLDAVEAARADSTSGVELHSFMLLRNGNVVAEGWWDPYAPELRHMLFSLSKSFTSTAVGFAVNEGLLSLEDKVSTFFPEAMPDTVSANLAAMRVRDLLTMSTGQVGIAQIVADRPNWVESFLAYPVTYGPGSHFYYNTMATFTLSAILSKVTGQSLTAYLTPRLFTPLGIDGLEWDRNPQGIDIGGAGLNITTEDIARFGQLYLQKGVWNGTRILPEGWVEEATARQVATSEATDEEASRDDWAQGYGYQFWRTTHGAYRGDGAFGQFAVVLPEQNAVFVTTGGSSNMQAVLNLAWEHLLPAFHEAPLPGTEPAQTQLRQKLAALTLLPSTGAKRSPRAARVSGKTYRLDDNDLGLRSITFDFTGDACDLILRGRSQEQRIACNTGAWAKGQDPAPLLPQPAILNLPVHTANTAVTGTWLDDDTFQMTLQLAQSPFRDRITAHFHGNEVRIRFTRGVGGTSFSDEPRPTLHGRF